MPCLNEAETLAICIDKAQGYLARSGVAGEVIIADNGSTDGSQQIAAEAGARVVPVADKGYGNALMGGIVAAHGTYVIMGDADDSYDFSKLDPFVERLRAGDELVMGNRFRGGIAPGAMPPLHKYLGNPVLSTVGRVLFRSDIKDFHCGLRGFNRESILNLGLITTGMEFASEVVVKSTLGGLRISEVPTTLDKDGRSRPPHLRSWRDGWRHLRFLMLFSPRWLFLIPGLIGFVVGMIGTIGLMFGPLVVGNVGFDVSSQVYLAALTVVGWQAVLFALLTKLYARHEGFYLPRSRSFERFAERATLENGALIGVGLFILGVVIGIVQLVAWGASGFGSQDPIDTMRLAVPAALFLMLGAQTVMASMFLGILSIDVRRA
ncbi:glycosyltransferase family 2 protein [Glaciibacter flavus]|uniref:Glycosyltransferase family 2 protein n=2 Tax=Orlajensenia flava TaxID=2565934 RepID=A0A4S4G2B3_9MICO|nr:glycosyltransferase family 2 protein [Glaciibacter flavus]